MAKRREVPDGIETSATASVVGVLKRQRPSRYAALEQHNVNRVELEVGDQDIPVLAHRELADTLAGMESGWALKVGGKIVRNRWVTCDGRTQMETVIEADRIERL